MKQSTVFPESPLYVYTFKSPLVRLRVALGDDLVEREFAAGLHLAGSAVAEDVLLLGNFHAPLSLAAVALALVLRHGVLSVSLWSCS